MAYLFAAWFCCQSDTDILAKLGILSCTCDFDYLCYSDIFWESIHQSIPLFYQLYVAGKRKAEYFERRKNLTMLYVLGYHLPNE